jgi:hypothetical protein
MPSEASLANLRAHTWQPGQSGYTGHQPKGYRRVLALARKNSPEAMETIIGCLRDADPRVRLTAATTILDRAWGKPKEHLTVDGDGIATLRIEFVDPRTDPDMVAHETSDAVTTVTIEATPEPQPEPDADTFEVAFGDPEDEP